MKTLVCFLFIAVLASAQTYNTWTNNYYQRIQATGFAPQTQTWLDSLVVGPNNGAISPGAPFPDPGSVPTATPTPTPQGTNPPVMPTSAPSYVTDCPNLAFSDKFNETTGSTLSEWGPITAPVKWIVNKPDGLNFGGYINHASSASWAYPMDSGHLVIDMHNFYQVTGQPGDGNWYGGQIASAAWKNQTGGGTATTGFTAAAPCYWEIAIWTSRLTPYDVPNAAGLWPSISLYTDPQLVGSFGSSMEIDVLEAYSINYQIPHYSWHTWTSGGAQINAGGAAPTIANISQGWHIYGIWIDPSTVTWYVDGVQVFSQPNQGAVGQLPFYLMITNGYGGGAPGNPGPGGGFTLSMTPSQTYNMHVAYVACWSH